MRRSIIITIIIATTIISLAQTHPAGAEEITPTNEIEITYYTIALPGNGTGRITTEVTGGDFIIIVLLIVISSTLFYILARDMNKNWTQR